MIKNQAVAVNNLLVTGASGFIGPAVVEHFKKLGYSVSRLVRHPEQKGPDAIYWNPINEEIHPDELEGFHAVIHLAGKNIAAERWTHRVKEEIFLSRVRQTWLLSHALSRLKRPPKVFFSASAVGYYGDQGNDILTESSPQGSGFLADVCKRWEEASQILDETGVRVIRARFGLVLAKEGGLLGQLLPFFKWGLGAQLGSGKQWMSWIALDDLLRALEFAILQPQIQGTYNFTSPHPVTNEEFTKTLGRALHRPTWRIPEWFLTLLGGQRAKELLLASTRAIPDKLLKSGFEFRTPLISLEVVAKLALEAKFDDF